ncbi:hypothetical protein GCM10023080_095370 [Streptomyces pseudoechinosporeus]
MHSRVEPRAPLADLEPDPAERDPRAQTEGLGIGLLQRPVTQEQLAVPLARGRRQRGRLARSEYPAGQQRGVRRAPGPLHIDPAVELPDHHQGGEPTGVGHVETHPGHGPTDLRPPVQPADEDPLARPDAGHQTRQREPEHRPDDEERLPVLLAPVGGVPGPLVGRQNRTARRERLRGADRRRGSAPDMDFIRMHRAGLPLRSRSVQTHGPRGRDGRAVTRSLVAVNVAQEITIPRKA